MIGALWAGVCLCGFVLMWVRVARYMIDNPPRYIGDDE
jgi:hypothetical protein